ncbi:hypothetical protein F2Q70_00003620 [Brassica cretica]|uniref:Uncharacterized protein n=1 Tax=Brassica cretica TaxID=69181 RepID=A0A8S9IKI1_BRACR|nr:hypothetical protein F2Q70_00003620 [Brassica cretica]
MADPLGLFVKLSISLSLAPLFRCLGTFSLLFLKVEMGFSAHSIALHQFWVVALGRCLAVNSSWVMILTVSHDATDSVHAQQYQQQQGNSTATLTRSCKFGTFDPQGSALLID